MTIITINVTQRDIDMGIKESNVSCPIARAIKRIFKNKYVSVTPYNIVIGIEPHLLNWERRIETTSTMREFIFGFDHDNPVQPTKFRLQIEDITNG